MTLSTLVEIVSLIIYFQISQILSQVIKSTKLTPTTISSVSNISVTSGPGTTVIGDIWSINVINQQGSDLSLQLLSSWGFHPIYPSTIQLLIHGNTSIQTYNDDGEIMFIFSVADQYFAELISLDSRKSAYKECPATGLSLITRDISNMINSPQPLRYYRYCNNSLNVPIGEGIDFWSNTQPLYKQPVQWPMFVQITNDPITNTVLYHYRDFANGGTIKTSSSYSSAFATNQGLNIYISGDSHYEDFNIFSLDVTYNYTAIPILTFNPTVSSTMHPSITPSNNPSNVPSKSPSNGPSKAPLIMLSTMPTAVPSVIPTQNPSIVPSDIPSNTPSIIPSVTPTNYPTVTPIRLPSTNPSNIPTLSPSNLPSTVPSVIPSDFPTLFPTNQPSTTPSEVPTFGPTNSPTDCIYLKKNYTMMNGADIDTNSDDIISSVILGNNSYGIHPTHFVNKYHICANQYGCNYYCIQKISCFEYIIHCHNPTGCNVICNDILSCGFMTIIADSFETSELNIICNGSNSCQYMEVNISNIAKANIHCLSSSSCLQLKASINQISKNNTNTSITCYEEHACDNIYILSDVPYTKLNMFAYSKNVTLNNNYRYSSHLDTITCGLDQKFIKYQFNDTNTIQQLVEATYPSKLLPCQDVHIIYNTSNINNAYCKLKYIYHGIDANDPALDGSSCIYVSLYDVVTLQCNISSSLSSLTTQPSILSNAPSKIPSIAPSLSPSVMPSCFSSTNTFSSGPSLMSSVLPSFILSIAPTIEPTINPTLPPSQRPSGALITNSTFSPTLESSDIEQTKIEHIISEQSLDSDSMNTILIIIACLLIFTFIMIFASCILCFMMIKMKGNNKQPTVNHVNINVQNIDNLKIDNSAPKAPEGNVPFSDDTDDSDIEAMYNNVPGNETVMDTLQYDSNQKQMEHHMKMGNIMNRNQIQREMMDNEPEKLWFDERVQSLQSNDIYYNLCVQNEYDKLRSIRIEKQEDIDNIMMEIDHLKYEGNENEEIGIDLQCNVEKIFISDDMNNQNDDYMD